MDNFRWYDWFLIAIFADFGSALVMAILSGSAPFGVMILPVWVFVWLMYEDIRRKQYDKESD